MLKYIYAYDGILTAIRRAAQRFYYLQMARQIRSICKKRNRCGYATSIPWWQLWTYIWNNSHHSSYFLIPAVSSYYYHLFFKSFATNFNRKTIIRSMTHFRSLCYLNFKGSQCTLQINFIF